MFDHSKKMERKRENMRACPIITYNLLGDFSNWIFGGTEGLFCVKKN